MKNNKSYQSFKIKAKISKIPDVKVKYYINGELYTSVKKGH